MFEIPIHQIKSFPCFWAIVFGGTNENTPRQVTQTLQRAPHHHEPLHHAPLKHSIESNNSKYNNAFRLSVLLRQHATHSCRPKDFYSPCHQDPCPARHAAIIVSSGRGNRLRNLRVTRHTASRLDNHSCTSIFVSQSQSSRSSRCTIVSTCVNLHAYLTTSPTQTHAKKLSAKPIPLSAR